jgi:hypothetical protein
MLRGWVIFFTTFPAALLLTGLAFVFSPPSQDLLIKK